jgi:hypothetical protein
MRVQVDGHIQLWDARAANAPVIVFQQQVRVVFLLLGPRLYCNRFVVCLQFH